MNSTNYPLASISAAAIPPAKVDLPVGYNVLSDLARLREVQKAYKSSNPTPAQKTPYWCKGRIKGAAFCLAWAAFTAYYTYLWISL